MDFTFISATLAAICRCAIIEDENMLEILEHLQNLIRGVSTPQTITNKLNTGQIKQLKPFRRTLQGVRGGGTNPVVSGGLSLRGHHLQADTEDTEACGEQRL